MVSRLTALPQLSVFRSRTFGHVSKLMLANVFGIVLSTITAPLIARLYSPTAVGEFALFVGLAAMLTPLFTLRYETAIMLPKSDEESAGVFKLVERLALVWLVLITAIVFFLPESVFKRAGYEALYPWRVGAVFTGFFFAMTIGITACHNRAQGYGVMSGSKVLQNAIYAVFVLGLGWFGVWSGQIIATLVSTLLAVIWLKHKLKIQLPALKWRQALTLARKHSNAPRYLFPTTMLDTFTKQLPVFLITAWFSTELAGSFSIAWRLVFIPVGLLGAAVGQVFFQRFSQAWPDRREARRLLIKTWLMLAPLGLVPCVIFVLFGPELFAWGLGEKWRQAGVMATLIAPVTFCAFVSSPTSNSFLVLGLQKYSLIFGIAVLIYRPICLWIGWHFHDLNLGLKVFTVAEVIQILIYNLVVFHKTSEK